MLNYGVSVLFFILAVVDVNSFTFPDDSSLRTWGGRGYDENDYGDSRSYGYRPSNYDHGYHPGHNGNDYGNVGDYGAGYGNHGYGYGDRDRRPNYGGVNGQSQANAQAQSSGFGGSAAKSESGSQYFNDFSQSYGQSGSQAYPIAPSYSPYGAGNNLGGSSASSSASASSSVGHGFGGASASAASASSSSSSGGFGNGPNRPWFHLRSGASDDDSESNESDDSSNAHDDGITFKEE